MDTEEEVDKIAYLLLVAREHHLEVEVIWSYTQAIRRGRTVLEAACYALNEWDI